MDEAQMRCPLCVVVGIGMFLLFAVWLLSATGAMPERIAAAAEQHAAQRLSAAGFPWASLRIDGEVGRLVGAAPDEPSHQAALEAARLALQPMMGIPGVFARLYDGVSVVPPAAAATPEMPAAGSAAPPSSPAADEPAAEAVADSPSPTAPPDAPGSTAMQVATAAMPPAVSTEVPAETAVAEATPDASSAQASTPTATDTCTRDLASLSTDAPIHFAFASSALPPDSLPILDRIAGVIAGCPGRRIAIEGHTDSLGPSDRNLALSQTRAAAVRDGLIERGVPSAQLEAIGLGEGHPIDSAETDAAWERNRRIEFRVLGAASGQ